MTYPWEQFVQIRSFCVTMKTNFHFSIPIKTPKNTKVDFDCHEQNGTFGTPLITCSDRNSDESTENELSPFFP